MDRGTIKHFSSRENTPWHGYVIQADGKCLEDFQSRLDKLLEEKGHERSGNSLDLAGITSLLPDGIIFFAGAYSQKTREMIERHLVGVNVVKAIQGNYEFFIGPFWVKTALKLPPSGEVSDFLAKKRN